MKVYLAGPDVFRKDPKAYGELMKDTLEKYGLIGLWPFDNEVPANCTEPKKKARTIYQANLKMIKECDFVFANISPFRGPSLDPGTAFEIGYAVAIGRPVIAYTNNLQDYIARVSNTAHTPFPSIEDFGLCDNLMIACAIGSVVVVNSFEDAISHLIKKIMTRGAA